MAAGRMIRERAAAVGLIVALAAILLHWPGFGYDEFRRPVVLLGAALALAAGAGALRVANTTPKPPQGGEGGWLLRMSDLGLLVIAVSALVAVNPADAGAALFPPVAAWIFLRATVLGWIPRDFLERRGLQMLSIAGLVFSGLGLCQYWGGDLLGFARGTKLAVSTVGNTNYAGVLSVAFALAGLAAAIFERGIPRRMTGAAAALLGLLHMAVSGSFGGLLGLAAGGIAFAALLVRRHGWKPVALIPLVILVVAVAAFPKRVANRVSDIARGEDRTSRIRLGLWKGAFRLAAAHPILGCGAGSFRAEFPPYRDAEERRLSHEGVGVRYVEAEDPHNTYLAILSESGPVALIAILAALVLAVVSGFRRAREPDSGAAGLVFAGTAGLIALATSADFNSLSGHLPFAILGALFAGFSAPVASPVPAPPWTRVSAYAAAVLLAVAPIPWLRADVHYRSATYLTDQAPERIEYAQKAIEALPGHWQARFEIALCWRALGEMEGTVRSELREVLRLHPHGVAAMIALADGAPPEEQEELLKRAERLAPEYELVLTRLLGVDLRKRDYPSARRRLERMLEVQPEEAEVTYTIGRTWLWERKPEEALPWLKRAIAKNPKMRERLADDHPELKSDSRFAGLMGP